MDLINNIMARKYPKNVINSGRFKKGHKSPSFWSGKKLSEEHKKKLSDAQTGRVAWNKGKVTSIETRKKLSIACLLRKKRLGYILSPATRKKNSERMKGKKGYWSGKKRPPLSEETKDKIREANKGKVASIETRKKMSESRRGSKGGNWKGGITPENERVRASTEIRLWREAVFARNNWTCMKCSDKRGGNLHSHHIHNFADYIGLRTSIENGITFCKHCHRLFHHIYGIKKNNKEQLKEFLKL